VDFLTINYFNFPRWRGFGGGLFKIFNITHQTLFTFSIIVKVSSKLKQASGLVLLPLPPPEGDRFT